MLMLIALVLGIALLSATPAQRAAVKGSPGFRRVERAAMVALAGFGVFSVAACAGWIG